MAPITSPAARASADVNAVIGGFLRDLAFAQSSQQKMFGYKRAASAILGLDVPLRDAVDPSGAFSTDPWYWPGLDTDYPRDPRDRRIADCPTRDRRERPSC